MGSWCARYGFQNIIASRTVTTKQAMLQTMKFWRTKGKRTKPTSIKSAADAIGQDLAVYGLNGNPHLGTLRHCIHNPREVTEAVRQILQRLMNVDPGNVSQKGIQWLYRGANPRTVAQKCTQGIHPKTALIRLYWGANSGLVSQKCIQTSITQLDRGANPGLVSRNYNPTWLKHRKVMRSWLVGKGVWGFWLIWKLDRQTNRTEYRRRDRWDRQRICSVSKKVTLNTVELPRERYPETLSPPFDVDASNQVKGTNILPPGQKCANTFMTWCESRASVPKMHSGNSS